MKKKKDIYFLSWNCQFDLLELSGRLLEIRDT